MTSRSRFIVEGEGEKFAPYRMSFEQHLLTVSRKTRVTSTIRAGAVLGKNIWGASPLIIWEATTDKQNYYKTNYIKRVEKLGIKLPWKKFRGAWARFGGPVLPDPNVEPPLNERTNRVFDLLGKTRVLFSVRTYGTKPVDCVFDRRRFQRKVGHIAPSKSYNKKA